MIVHGAQGGDATGSQAGISALLACACEIHGTVGVDATFCSTVRRRSNVRWQTGTRWGPTNVPALCVHAAWRGHAGVCRGEGAVVQGRF